MSAGVVLQQMIIIFLLIMTGYAVCKKGLVKPEASTAISALVVNICNPAILLQSSFERDPAVTNGKLLSMVIGGAVLYAFLIAASLILPKIVRAEARWEKHYALLCLFGNTGFIGIPLVSAVLGSRAVLYVAVNNTYFNLLFYTYGIWLCGGDKGRFSWKNFLNMGNLAAALTIIIYLCRIQLPAIVTSTVTHMANSTTFLAMFVIGMALARTELITLFNDLRMYVFIALRFLVLPVAICLVLRIFIHDPLVYGVLVLMAAVPSGNLPFMRVEETGGDGSLLSRGIILSTVLSIVTIPIVVLLI